MKDTEQKEFLQIVGPEVDLKVGMMGVANESRFDSAFLSEPLTAYVAGYRDPTNLDDILNYVAPRVPVGRRFEYYKGDKNSEFYAEKDDADVRSIGADFKVIKIQGSVVSARTLSKGLTIRMDRDEAENDADFERKQQLKVAKIMRILRRTELIRAMTLLVAAGGTATQKNWAQATGNTDPDSDVLSAIDATRASGVIANRILYADSAFTLRILGLRAQDNPGGYASSGMTLEQLAAFLGVDGVRNLTGMVYDRSATTKLSGVGKAGMAGYRGRVLGFNAQDGLDVDDPSTIKRFVSSAGTGDFTVFVQDISAKIVDVTVSHYSLIAQTMADGAFSLEVR